LSPAKHNASREWYSISVDAIRYTVVLLVVLVVLGVGFVGYERWNEHRMERLAYEWISKPESLMRQLRAQEIVYRDELDSASLQLEEARRALREGAHGRAIEHGRISFGLLDGILERVRLGGSLAWFVSVQGNVEYRRGESGEFLRAYPRTELNEGDYIQSGGSSSAEVHFRNEGTVFTLRPNSLVKLSREQTGRITTLGFMEYGVVSLDTSETPTSVATRHSRLEAGQNTQASIELRPGANVSVTRVEQGQATVQNLLSGESRTLGERRQITQESESFGPEIDLPAQPALVGPPDDWSINSDKEDQVELIWKPVESATRYALQVSRSRLFADTIIDDQDRLAPRARLGIIEDGRYRWRVAAIDRRGNLGPWSEVREFRVASWRELALDADNEPPVIRAEIQMNGNIALVRGATEPGSRLQINDEDVTVFADGSFTTVRTLYGYGWQALVFRATDRAGNTTTQVERVALDES
jgi:hypothetical protein